MHKTMFLYVWHKPTQAFVVDEEGCDKDITKAKEWTRVEDARSWLLHAGIPVEDCVYLRQ
jgi:hypothetical protein